MLLFVFVHVGFIHSIKEGPILPVLLTLRIKKLILLNLKYLKRLAAQSWVFFFFFAFSICKHSRMNVCRVSLHKSGSCEISLICSYFSVVFCGFSFDSSGVFLPFSDVTELKTKSNTSLDVCIVTDFPCLHVHSVYVLHTYVTCKSARCYALY